MFGKSFFSWVERPLDTGRRLIVFVLLAGIVFSVMAIQPVSPVAAVGEVDPSLLEDLSTADIGAGEWEAIQAEMAHASYQFTWYEDQAVQFAWAPNVQHGFDLQLESNALHLKTSAGDFELGLHMWGTVPMAEAS